MKITLGKATGFDLVKTNSYRGFLLMVRGWEVSYVHYIQDYIGIAWSRSLTIGKRKWWFTDSWKVWAKKTPLGFRYVLKKK